MRAIWKGSVAFGLVNVPVKLYGATGEHEVTLHQVHREDGGRIRYRKVCSIDGEEVTMTDIAKGYQTADGEIVVLDDEDFAQLPLSTEREISVLEFVPADQVDPIMLSKTYYLEPEKAAVKPYALLRQALDEADRVAVVKVALRQRESMAVLRVRGDVICLQTLLWPDEIRDATFPVLDTDVSVRPAELTMAASLIESLAADFDPSPFEDQYQQALEALIERKINAGKATAPPQAEEDEVAAESGQVVDLLAALQRSVESARKAREGAPAESGADESGREGVKETAAKKTAAKKTATKQATAKAPAKKTAAKKTTAKSRAS
jgi:DNA end-binding protein Ku